MRKKTARVTIETERLLVIGRTGQSIEARCEACEMPTHFVSVEAAATIGEVSQRMIFRWAEAETIHLIETSDGKAMFCLNSIVKQGITNQRRLLRS